MDMGGRVKREIQYLKLLRHPHIIKLYEVITTPTDIIMVIEYAGRELFNYIVEKGRMSEEDARCFFQQIICAVEYCHRHKIVHRDLKPEKYVDADIYFQYLFMNIPSLLLDGNNNVKIADFGLSNIMTDGDFLKTSCGSPNYAAPEVISGKLYAGPEVDVWSCGVILYVMLCGRLPFDDEYIPTLFKKINGGIYTMPSFLSPETKYLLTSMLVVDPMKRITIHEIRQNPWFNTNLPDYLRPLPTTQEDSCQPIDDSIVSELCKKMNYPKETIYKSLGEKDNNQFKVAYQLVVDHKRLLKDSKHNNIQSFFATSPPPWNTTFDVRTEVHDDDAHNEGASSISVLSSSLPKSEIQMPSSSAKETSSWWASANGGQPIAPITGTPPPGAIPSSLSRGNSSRGRNPQQKYLSAQASQYKRSPKPRSKWHFGIRSKCPAWEVMLEIYRSLQHVGMEWRTLDTYHLRCRYQYSNIGLVVKFDLQLYKLDNNSYLVDFKNVDTSRVTSEADVDHQFSRLEETLQKNTAALEGMQFAANEDNDENGQLQQFMARRMDADPSAEHVRSVYPFLDVCSRLIADIV
ncbi:Protein kinase [Apophysomyces sp. BC1034]|nr:Protein kinase [Apophysomyces sp. BC1015]KAG0184696.1 Protein kinase [Apophysomyces sp. BC1034]